jgi:hypothetical protein
MTFSFSPTSLSRLPCTAGFGEHAGRFLEGCRRDEAAGLQAGLGDAQQDRLALRRARPSAIALSLTSSNSALSTCSPLRSVVSPLSRISHFLEHLAHDHLDVLVVDLHALQAIDVLHLVDQVVGQRLDAHDPQDVMRGGVAVHDVVAALDEIALLHGDVLALGHHVFDRLEVLVGGSMVMRRLFL